MVSTSSDDYYASLDTSSTPSSGKPEQKKKLIIVAKKVGTPTDTADKSEDKSHPKDVSPTSPVPAPEPVAPTPPPEQPYVKRVIRLPESDTLDLGVKLDAHPKVVFTDRQLQPLGKRPVPGRVQRPLTQGQGRGRGPGSGPGSSGGPSSHPANKDNGQQRAKNFRKPDAPKKNFKTSKKGAKKLSFVEDDGGEGAFRRQKQIAQGTKERNVEDIRQTLVDRSGQEVEIGNFISVKEFSDKIGVPVARIMGELMKNGIIVNLNSQIDFDTCFLIAEPFDVVIKKALSTDNNLTDLIDGNIDAILADDDVGEQVDRPPVISVMGHVDHGKTSILDSIRKTSVASGEAGGITQKIGAYQAHHHGRDITFIDTPGHEAFALMRSRGARLTDIIILVVAADEGLKPQTIESINLAKEAEVPVVVAINKIDKPGANIDMVKRALAEHELTSEDWGGDVICVPCSAKTGEGIDTLLDMVLLVADMKQFKAHPSRPGVGTVIESYLDPGQGVVATILLNAGILEKGDAVTCGEAYGKIRTMKTAAGKNINEATSSMPVQITGLDVVPEGGQVLQVVAGLEEAREKSQAYKLAAGSKSINKFEQASLGNLMSKLKSGALQNLKIVLKADTNGSLEALKASLVKIKAKDVQVKIIHAGIGAINESDVLMAGSSSALLIAFNVTVGSNAINILAKSKIEVIAEKVIYRIIEKVESIATGMIDVKYDQVLVGEGKALQIFYTAEKMQIVGLSVTSGHCKKKAQLKIIRNERVAGTGLVENLKQGVYDMSEIEEGNECGIQYKGDVRVEAGDQLEFYMTVERK